MTWKLHLCRENCSACFQSGLDQAKSIETVLTTVWFTREINVTFILKGQKVCFKRIRSKSV